MMAFGAVGAGRKDSYGLLGRAKIRWVQSRRGRLVGCCWHARHVCWARGGKGRNPLHDVISRGRKDINRAVYGAVSRELHAFTWEGRKQPAGRWAREGQALAQVVNTGGKTKLAGAGLKWEPTWAWARWPTWSSIWPLK